MGKVETDIRNMETSNGITLTGAFVKQMQSCFHLLLNEHGLKTSETHINIAFTAKRWWRITVNYFIGTKLYHHKFIRKPTFSLLDPCYLDRIVALWLSDKPLFTIK